MSELATYSFILMKVQRKFMQGLKRLNYSEEYALIDEKTNAIGGETLFVS